ncbi:MAG: hypothetical protein ISS91_02500 [Candidatus Omnitrophica bacterium]|nr:hypothetical protein [Candidatus Omnitrophota bacterium]
MSAVLIAALFLAGIIYAFSGRVFLDFIGNELHIGLNYSNWVDFVSCFVIRRARLDDPVFIIKDFRNIAITADFAFLEPSFDRLLDEKGITVTFTLKNVRLASPVVDTTSLSEGGFLPSDLWPVVSEGAFEEITTTIFMHGDTAEFLNFGAVSENIKISARGVVSEKGYIDISAHILFSPSLVNGLPENIKQNLKTSLSGWGKYNLKFAAGSSGDGLRIESDRIKIEFEKVDVR